MGATIFVLVLLLLFSYLMGSIPFSLVVGKLFFKKDIRNFGSGNLGGTNTGRVLGKGAGFAVMVLDQLKAVIAILIGTLIMKHMDPNFVNLTIYLSSICIVLGHCYPIFAKFKGGKAVASIAGFVLFMNWRITLLAFFVFLLVALTTKIISLASMSAMTVGAICIFIPFFTESYLFTHGELNNQLSRFIYFFSIILLALLLIYRHYPNIQRLLKGEEKKFKIEKIFKNDKK